MTPDCMQEQLELVMRQAGKLLMSYYGRSLEIIPKKQSFTTQADAAVEQFLLRQLKDLVPGASFYAEESGISGEQASDYCWVIDPLDGTTNFAHGIPYFCISIALTLQGKPIIAGVYQPLLDEFFYAQAHTGAWLNKTLLKPYNHTSRQACSSGLPEVQDRAGIARSPIIVVWPGHRAARCNDGSYTFRYFGAVALDCAYLACGKIDGLVLNHAAWWDIAARLLLLQELGIPLTYSKRLVSGQERYRVMAGDIAKSSSKS